MKSVIKQFVVACLVAVCSVVGENLSGATLASEFVRSNGVMLIATLIAVNLATFAVLIGTMHNMEQMHNRPYFFDLSKIEALKGIREMLFLLGVFYFLMAMVPDSYWQNKGLQIFQMEPLVSFLVAIVSRACIFQTVYAIYDFTRGLVKLTTDPNMQSR